jgi:DNA-binding transcriptional MocR family regulator
MTSWTPALAESSGPLYVRLADRIEADIGEGALPPGSKLPPQRNLAFDIGVTVGTVGRAYAILRQRGLVSGEVGRGTYVLGRERAAPGKSAAEDAVAGTRRIMVAPGMLPMDSTAAPNVGQAEILGRLAAEVARDRPDEVTSYTRKLPPGWTAAGRRWLSAGGWSPAEDAIVPSLGGHAAILAVIAAVTAPGDKIVFEHLTYSSIARSASLIGRRSIAVDMDEDGLEPADFERVCAQQHPTLAFLMPGLQNPTLTIMPEGRRRDIVAIARKHNVWLIEDAIYAALLDEQPAPIAALAPERTFHIGGLSKSVSAGARGGWAACPPGFAPRVLTAYKMLTGGKPFMLAELAARLVLSGAADDIRARAKAEIAVRGALARESFDGYDFAAHERAPFVWMKLPEPWMSGTFKNAAANESVLIDDEDEYKCGRTDRVFHRVRIGFSAPSTRDEAATGFARLRSLLENPASGYDSYG